MKFKDRQVNLELSKELKTNGYKQEGLFWWIEAQIYYTEKENFGLVDTITKEAFEKAYSGRNILVAPTLAELGKKLPNSDILRYIDEKLKGLSKEQDKCLAYIIMDLLKNPNAMAKMWLYLKKEKLI